MSAPDSLTLADLRTRTFPHPSLGVLGDPIAHSLSPAMHNAALAALRPTHPTLASLHYLRLHITAAELPAALLRLRELGFAGLNLTVPHKISALTLVTELSDEARRAESVNTLVPTAQGWAGHTTDGQGFLEALREHSSHGISGRPVRLLGAGGAARAVATACLAAGCSELHIVNRDIAKGTALAAALAAEKQEKERRFALLGRRIDGQCPQRVHRFDALLGPEYHATSRLTGDGRP